MTLADAVRIKKLACRFALKLVSKMSADKVAHETMLEAIRFDEFMPMDTIDEDEVKAMAIKQIRKLHPNKRPQWMRV